MIKSIKIINFREEELEVSLTSPYETGFIVQKIEDLGPVKADINTTASVLDGSMFNSAKLGNRNITLELAFTEENKRLESIEDLRQKSYKFFPTKKPLILQIFSDNRQLETAGYVESNEPDIFSQKEGCKISIICTDPYYRQVDGNRVTVFNGIEPLFEFPFENDSLTEPLIEFGEIQHRKEVSVLYEGDADSGVLIEMHAIGRVDGINIVNTNTRAHLKINTEKIKSITGSYINKPDTLYLDTRRGHKSLLLLRNGKFINILNCIEKGSDWFTVSKGNNWFAYFCDYGDENLQFKVINDTLYEGI